MKKEAISWIIGKSGTEWDDVQVAKFTGTIQQAKELLVSFVRTDKQGSDTFDCGTESVSDVEVRGDVLYAVSMFRYCHNDYTATPLDVLEELTPVSI